MAHIYIHISVKLTNQIVVVKHIILLPNSVMSHKTNISWFHKDLTRMNRKKWKSTQKL